MTAFSEYVWYKSDILLVKCPPQFPGAQGHIFKCLVVSKQQYKTQPYYNHLKLIKEQMTVCEKLKPAQI